MDVLNSRLADLSTAVWEPYRLKESVLSMATEVSCMILKIDQLIKV